MPMEQHFQGTPIPARSPLPLTGVSKRKRSIFYTQLARMLRAGISPVKTLRTLAEHGGSWRLKRAAARMAAHIETGGSLASAFAAEPNLFPASEVRMVEASELGGAAPDTLLRISRFLDQLIAAQRKVVTGMIYPTLCLFFVFFILPNVLWLLFPRMFPPVWHYHLMFVASCAGAWLGGTVIWRTLTAASGVRYAVHAVLNCVPIAGGLLRKLAWARFANTFECLYSAGVLSYEALACSASACGNAVIGRRLLHVVPQVQAGGSLAQALASSRALPPLGLEMIAVGEQAGKLQESLLKFAEYQQEDLATGIQRFARVLTVVIILGYIALMVVLIFLAFSALLGTYSRALSGG